MGLYTVRVRMVPFDGFPRGGDEIEMTHHFAFETDDAALAGVDSLRTWWSEGPIGNRWLCRQQGEFHEVAIFRRDITARRTWHHLATHYFTLPNWRSYGPLEFKLGDAPFSVKFAETALYRHRAGAVLVIEKTIDPLVKRRVYIGPISPVCLVGKGTIGLPLGPLGEVIGDLNTLMGTGFNGDYPFDPDSDTVDAWRDDIRDRARDHVAHMGSVAGDGFSVVPSWKYATVLTTTSVHASSVRAEVHSRGVRGPMSAPAT